MERDPWASAALRLDPPYRIAVDDGVGWVESAFGG
jgi:hypothetical protein